MERQVAEARASFETVRTEVEARVTTQLERVRSDEAQLGEELERRRQRAPGIRVP